jgi:hypothetical protein
LYLAKRPGKPGLFWFLAAPGDFAELLEFLLNESSNAHWNVTEHVEQQTYMQLRLRKDKITAIKIPQNWPGGRC